jgi:hypothetical protein
MANTDTSKLGEALASIDKELSDIAYIDKFKL